MSIGENLRRLRENRGMSQAEIAQRVSVSQSMIAQIERGTKVLSFPLGMEIANVLQCDILDLIREEERG
ncbi:MAG TPA: helix-turn-helix domain-containing protein [Firmicutes bacterium]|nr:helix-turn-helix domain-containing protein [Bacillota bacterium]